MKVLLITSQYPRPDAPFAGIFIQRQVEELRRQGVDVDVFAYHGAKNPLNYVRAWWQVRKKLKDTRYDVVHAQFGNSGILALPKRLPLVVTFHGSDVKGIYKNGRYTWLGKVLQFISRQIALIADEAIIVADNMRAYLPTSRNYSVIATGVNQRIFVPMEQSKARRFISLNHKAPIIFFPANPNSTVKRFSLAQASIELVQQQMPSVQFIVGGAIAPDEMPYYLNACDTLLLSSVHEGSPTIVKEALCCNLPIVSVDVGDVRERLQDIEGCAIVDDQPQALADALLKVLQTRQRLQADAVAEKLSAEYEVERVIEIYQRAIAKHHASKSS
jgi:teichuronic acid biosynthesis glycosyltransferase TuaC